MSTDQSLASTASNTKWNPDIYNDYRTIREKPFYDLLNLVKPPFSPTSEFSTFSLIDLGCGTGQLTNDIPSRFPNASIVGSDSSAEMLSKQPEILHPNVTLVQNTIENELDFSSSQQKYDIVLSNAAMQWIGDHAKLFPLLLQKVKKPSDYNDIPDSTVPKPAYGQLAIQMPCQSDNILNQILLSIVQREPFRSALGEMVVRSPVLSMDQYATILFQNGVKGENITIAQQIYPIIGQNAEDLYHFIEGSAVRPYMTQLDKCIQDQEEVSKLKAEFKSIFLQQINDYYNNTFPAIYAFKRMFIYAKLD